MGGPCHSCGHTCLDYRTLALHIMSERKKGHRKGKKWAAKYLYALIDGLPKPLIVEKIVKERG